MNSIRINTLTASLLLFLFINLIHGQTSDYYYNSRQISDLHRYDNGHMGSHWGHHLGHMVRTETQGLWYVDDTGINVNLNPAINYHYFNGNTWELVKTLNNPKTIQQNVTSMAIGDKIYSYGLNINGGYIEEAVFDATTRTGSYGAAIAYAGYSTNYIGGAVSPGGTRVVWWTRVVDNNGPSDWVYIYNQNGAWSQPIKSSIPGNDFSYVFSSFLDDTTMYVAGEVPGGIAPNWIFQMGTGKLVLGKELADFRVIQNNLTAHDIWVNTQNGDVHLFGQGYNAQVSYHYKKSGSDWETEFTYLPIGAISRFRTIEDKNDNIYFVFSQSGIKTVILPKSEITGKIDLNQSEVLILSQDEGFLSPASIWSEAKEFQTNPVEGLNFGINGADWTYSNLVRHVQLKANDGSVGIKLSLPNGGELFTGEQVRKITWYVNPLSAIDSIGLEFSSDGATSWSVIKEKVPNTGQYSWTVPTTNSDSCYIRLTDPGTSDVLDKSAEAFSIEWEYIPQTPPESKIIIPSADTLININSTLYAEGIGADKDGYILRYTWNSGDGSEYSGLNKKSISHTYLSSGEYYLTLKVKDNDDQWSVPDTILITVVDPAHLENTNKVRPGEYGLIQNYPNPFNPETIIPFQLPENCRVSIAIFDIQGRMIVKLISNQNFPAGYHEVHWDGESNSGQYVSSGIYFYTLETDLGRKIKKMTILH